MMRGAKSLGTCGRSVVKMGWLQLLLVVLLLLIVLLMPKALAMPIRIALNRMAKCPGFP